MGLENEIQQSLEVIEEFGLKIVANLKEIMCVCMTNDFKKIIACSKDFKICIWDLEEKKILHIIQEFSEIFDVAIAEDNNTFVICGKNKRVKIFKLSTFQVVQEFEWPCCVLCVGISKVAKIVPFGDCDGKVAVWDIRKNEIVFEYKVCSKHVWSLKFTPNYQKFVAGTFNGDIAIFDAYHLFCQQILKNDNLILCLHFTHDSKFLISGCGSNSIIYEFEHMRIARKLIGHRGFVRSISTTFDYEYIITGSNDKSIRIWNFFTSVQIIVLLGHIGPISSVLVTHTGLILSGSHDKTIRIWSLDKYEFLGTFPVHASQVTCLNSSKNQEYLFSGDKSGEIRVWDFNRKKMICELNKHQDTVKSLFPTPNGKYLVSTSLDLKCIIWKIIFFP